MIQIREEQWISPHAIESIFVREGKLQIVPIDMQGDKFPYLVEDSLLKDVCSALNLPYSTIQGIAVRQLQEKEDVR